MRKREREKVQNECAAYLLSIGAVEFDLAISDEYNIRFRLNTEIGACSIWISYHTRVKTQSIMVRFTCPLTAKRVFGGWKINQFKPESKDFPIVVKDHMEYILSKIQEYNDKGGTILQSDINQKSIL